MTNLQRVHLRISEVRSRLNELGGKDNLTNDETVEVSKLTKEYGELEVRFQALTVGGGDDADKGADKGADDDADKGADEGDAKARDLAKLQAKIELRSYLQAAMDGTPLAGAEKEFNDELGIDAGTLQVPWEALAPTVEERGRGAPRGAVEERVDTVTSVGATANLPTENVAPILARVFERSVAASLGVRMPAVGIGQRNYPVMTAGVTAEMQAAGGEVDADAATYTVTVINPTRLTARYVFRVEDLAVVAGLEASLREDLRMAMSDELDKQIITGDGTAPNLAGLFDSDSGLADPAAPSAETDVNGYINLVTGQVDGINAYRTQDVRLLIGPPTLRHAATKFLSNTDTSAYDMLMRLSGGVRVSARVPAAKAVASKQHQELLATRMNGFAVAPMWPTLSLVRDIYSGARKGEVALTAIALYGFKIVRANGFARLQVRLEA